MKRIYRPAASRLAGTGFLTLCFAGWSAASVYVLSTQARLGAAQGPAIVLMLGVPLLMTGIGVYLFLNLLSSTEIDDEGLRTTGPLGERRVRWADVVGYDVVGTSKQGVSLFLRDGQKVSVPFTAYPDGGELAAQIRGIVRSLPLNEAEGREFRLSSRWALPVLTCLILALFGWAAATGRPADREMIAGFTVPLGLLLATISIYGVTQKVVLRHGVLTRSSCFGSRSLPLSTVRGATLRVQRTKDSTSEVLTLTADRPFYVTANLEGYAMLRDAIIEALPCETVRKESINR